MHEDGNNMKKNVLLVSWKNSLNFGTNLQAIALYRVLQKKYMCTLLWTRRYMPIALFCKKAWKKLGNTIVSVFRHKRAAVALREKNISRCFEPMQRINLNSRKDLETILKQYSAYIVGSDQVWNPNYLEETYFLDFVPNGYNKCSYASSMGVNEIERRKQKKYKKYLKQFSYISMRESSAAVYLSKVLERPVDTVLDPTLLLTKDEWREYAKDACFARPLPQEYILCYFVGDRPAHWNAAEEIARTRGIPLLILPVDARPVTADGQTIDEAGPKEFIQLVDGANCIVTDSFHMCAFAINFGKEFYAFHRFRADDPKGQNSRLDDLFAMCHIDRYYDSEHASDRKAGSSDDPAIQTILSEERGKCLLKLYSAIEGDFVHV